MNVYDINSDTLPASLDNLVFADGETLLSNADVENLLRSLENSDV